MVLHQYLGDLPFFLRIIGVVAERLGEAFIDMLVLEFIRIESTRVQQTLLDGSSLAISLCALLLHFAGV